MRTPCQVVFHGMDHSDAVETRISEEIEKLERLNDRLTDCRVTVESPHHHHSKGAPYNISININVPGDTFVVSSGATDPSHDDVYIAVRDAFAAMSRRLKDFGDRKAAHRG